MSAYTANLARRGAGLPLVANTPGVEQRRPSPVAGQPVAPPAPLPSFV